MVSGQIKIDEMGDLIRLRRAGAPVESALRGFIRTFDEVPQGYDFADLLEVLREYDRTRGPLGAQVKKIISCLKSGEVVVSDDLRILQARRLWNYGFGRELGIRDFDTYLKGLPMIPETFVALRRSFPLLCLADPRPGLSESCSLLGIRFKGPGSKSVVPYNDLHTTPTEPFWFRFTAPGTNMYRRPSMCRDEFNADGNFAGTAMTGIMAYAHHPSLIEAKTRVLDLPGSRCCRGRYGTYLKAKNGHPTLCLDRIDYPYRTYGAGGFWWGG